MPGIYGADDVSALVLDIGTDSIRCGWAGEDAPRAVIPSVYGWVPDTEEKDAMNVDGEEEAAAKKDKWRLKGKKCFVGDSAVNMWREGMEIESPVVDGVVVSAPALLLIAKHAFQHLGADPKQHPLLITEPAWNTREAREALCDLAFEGLGVPAFYLANGTVLSAFSAGKSTSLILTVGSSSMSAIPVADGFVLRKSIRKSPLGGDAVSRALRHELSNPPAHNVRIGKDVDVSSILRGQYAIRSKQQVEPGKAPVAEYRDDRLKNTTASFNKYQETRVINEMKEAITQVLDSSWTEGAAVTKVPKYFEFPNGYNDAFGVERLRAAEILYTPSLYQGLEAVIGSSQLPPPLVQLVLDAAHSTDVDVRATLLSNIVCVGGTTSTLGFVERLSYELGIHAAGQKVKIHAAGNLVERRYSSWLGGSILASLGTFHQLWISKQEWEENGSAVVHLRCK